MEPAPTREHVATRVVVVGAGPAGLAVGACLRRAQVDFVLLEKEQTVGAAWHRHYDRLHLHTDRAHSSLPYLPLPREYPRYPSRQQVVDYFDAYARAFSLVPRYGEEVTTARRREEGWDVETRTALYRADALVLATGYNALPVRPRWPGMDRFRGAVLHSSEYRNGERFRGSEVLVVGFGNSGGEIAIDLVEHDARPTLAVRSPVNLLPRELLGIPILSWALALSRLPPGVADALAAPRDARAHDGHPGPARVLDDAVHVPAPEQLTKDPNLPSRALACGTPCTRTPTQVRSIELRLKLHGRPWPRVGVT